MASVLKPQDLVVVLHYALQRGRAFTLAATASMLGLSGSEVHASLKRAAQANLLIVDRKAPQGPMLYLVVREALSELVLHGVRYVYLVERGPLTRGFPTAHGTAPLDRIVRASGPPPVWPHPEGPVRGESFSPLYKNAHVAARSEPSMYKALALIDAIRGGRSREREAAKKLFTELVSLSGAA